MAAAAVATPKNPEGCGFYPQPCRKLGSCLVGHTFPIWDETLHQWVSCPTLDIFTHVPMVDSGWYMLRGAVFDTEGRSYSVDPITHKGQFKCHLETFDPVAVYTDSKRTIPMSSEADRKTVPLKVTTMKDDLPLLPKHAMAASSRKHGLVSRLFKRGGRKGIDHPRLFLTGIQPETMADEIKKLILANWVRDKEQLHLCMDGHLYRLFMISIPGIEVGCVFAFIPQNTTRAQVAAGLAFVGLDYVLDEAQTALLTKHPKSKPDHPPTCVYTPYVMPVSTTTTTTVVTATKKRRSEGELLKTSTPSPAATAAAATTKPVSPNGSSPTGKRARIVASSDVSGVPRTPPTLIEQALEAKRKEIAQLQEELKSDRAKRAQEIHESEVAEEKARKILEAKFKSEIDDLKQSLATTTQSQLDTVKEAKSMKDEIQSLRTMHEAAVASSRKLLVERGQQMQAMELEHAATVESLKKIIDEEKATKSSGMKAVNMTPHRLAPDVMMGWMIKYLSQHSEEIMSYISTEASAAASANLGATQAHAAQTAAADLSTDLLM